MNFSIDFIGYTGKTGSVIYNHLKTKYTFDKLVNTKNYKDYFKMKNHNNKIIIDFSTKEFILEFIKRECSFFNVVYVTGVTGFSEQEFREIDNYFKQSNIYGFHFPNFSLGINLVNKILERIAQFFDFAEIIEMHHKTKKDKPSGTSIMSAKIVEKIIQKEVPIHSIRLPSLVAHQKIIFTNEFGEILEITHHNLNRISFALGVEKVVQEIINNFEKIGKNYNPGLYFNLNLFNFLSF